jgi:hypothetical protein
MRKKLLPILVLTILLAGTLIGCSGGPSGNPSPLASLSKAAGDVSVSNDGDSWTGAHVGMSLDTGDGIKTGDNSTAQITFLDGSTIDLQANTEIDIVSLEISSETGSKTITLDQIIGDTISRVTHLVDPESSYEIDTPSGTAGVRGSSMRVRVIKDDPQYQDGTALVTNLEGTVYTVAHGKEVDVPMGQTCILIPGEWPELLPLARDDSASTLQRHRITIPVLDNDSGDTLSVSSVTQPAHGSVDNNGSNVTYIPDPDFPDFQGADSFSYTIMDGHDRTDTAAVTVTVAIVEEFADIWVTLEPGSAPIYIWDETSDWWAIDEITGYAVNGFHHETNMTITVAAGRRYYVWLQTQGTGPGYCPTGLPDGWEVRASPVGEYQAAYGYATPTTGEDSHEVDFAICEFG